MLHPKAVRNFLHRQRDNHEWVKDLSEKKLDHELQYLGFRPAWPQKPLRLHQKACFLLGVAYPSFAFWLDMGTGKTRLALELLRWWFHEGEVKVALILAPSESVIISWENQIKEWRINLPYVSLYNSPSSEKWDTVNEFDYGIILATYPGLTRMLTVLKKPEGKKRGKLTPKHSAIKRLAKKVDAMVLDESTKVSHKKSLAYRLCRQLAKTASIRYELAGLPFGRDPTSLWSQLYLIDKGETLGDTLGLFRAAFFDEEHNYWGGTEYTFKKSLEKELARVIRHRSISYAAEECIDLPKLVRKVEEVILPEEAKAYYDRFVKEIKASYAGYTERKNAFIRMRQVSSGFVGFVDEDKERAEISFATNPKLDRLIELVQDMPRRCKFVIVYEFTYSGRIICEALNDAGIKHVWGWGGTKSARNFQDDFDNDDAVHGAVLNHRWGGYGLNLQRANYTFIYEAPLSVIDDQQVRRRVNRQGQTRTVFETDLVCRGTADARILEFHKQGENLMKALLKNPVAALALK